MADERERQEASDRHYSAMRDLQNMRDDVAGILNDTINRHYDFPPDDLEGERAEREKLRQDLREVQQRIDRTLRGL